MTERMIRATIYIDEELLEQFRAACRERGVSMSEMIRQLMVKEKDRENENQ